MGEIDPKEFGRMQAQLEALRRDSDRQTETLDAIAYQIQSIQSTLSEAKGGWKLLMLVGGAAGAFGAFLSKISWTLIR